VPASKKPCMGHSLSRGDFHSFTLPISCFFNSIVRPPAEPFSRPGHSFRAPAGAGAVKDGPRATAKRREASVTAMSTTARCIGSGRHTSHRWFATRQRARDLSCSQQNPRRAHHWVGALIACHGLVFGRSFGDRTMVQSFASAAGPLCTAARRP
jgi:hypothetical protein